MKIAVVGNDCNNLATQTKAAQLAAQLGLPLLWEGTPDFTAYLVVDAGKVGLWMPAIAEKPYYVDFMSDKLIGRQMQQQSQKELIVKACRIKGLKRTLHILDATAGFGRDAFILASSGAAVTMLEKNPVVAALLQDGLDRLKQPYPDFPLRLIQQNASDYLKFQTMPHEADVIYLDPMFEEERRAKVKKDLQLLQALLAEELNDVVTLFDAALKGGAKRVVVKRAIHAKPLKEQKPDFSIVGKHTRFDVYQTG